MLKRMLFEDALPIDAGKLPAAARAGQLSGLLEATSAEVAAKVARQGGARPTAATVARSLN
jgi:hypothetical protein